MLPIKLGFMRAEYTLDLSPEDPDLLQLTDPHGNTVLEFHLAPAKTFGYVTVRANIEGTVMKIASICLHEGKGWQVVRAPNNTYWNRPYPTLEEAASAFSMMFIFATYQAATA